MTALPHVTIALMSYRQEEYVEQALKGVFAQDYQGPVDVLLSDDASPDRTAAFLHQAAARHHRPDRPVRVNVNTHNLGLIPHLHKVFAMARTDFVVLVAGDDFSRPDRVRKLVEVQQRTNAMLVYSGFCVMDEHGTLQPDKTIKTTFAKTWTLRDVAASDALFVGATAAYHKDIFRLFGPIIFEEAFEDLVLGFRAALSGRIGYCPDPLVDYRVGNSLSQAKQMDLPMVLRRFKARVAVFSQRQRDARIYGRQGTDPVLQAISKQLHADRDHILRIQAALNSQTRGSGNER